MLTKAREQLIKQVDKKKKKKIIFDASSKPLLLATHAPLSFLGFNFTISMKMDLKYFSKSK